MKLQRSRATIVALLFVGVSLVSFTYSLVAAVNYSSFWDARQRLTANVDSLKIETNPINGNVTIRATVSTNNPTSYYGMTVRYFELRLFFGKTGTNQTLFSGGSTGDLIDLTSTSNPPVGDPIGPHSTVTLIIALQLSSSQSSAFTKFEQPNPAGIYGQTSLIAIVDSFLDRSTGPETVGPSDQTVPLS